MNPEDANTQAAALDTDEGVGGAAGEAITGGTPSAGPSAAGAGEPPEAAESDPGQVPEGPTSAAGAGEPPEAAEGDPGQVPEDLRSPSPYRRPAFAAARAVVVLVVAAVGYQAVIPATHVVRARLARLVVTEPGVAGLDVKATQAAEQPASGTNLTPLVSASKQSPNATGLYAIEWMKSQTDAVDLAVFLLPTAAQAAAVLTQLRTQQLAATAFSSDGLTRRSTYEVKGIPGSMGAVFTPTTKANAASPSAAVTVFQVGRVVAANETVTSAGPQTVSSAVATTEYNHLRQVESGFTLKVVTRPPLASALWIAAAVALAALAALGPIARRRAAARRERRLQEELDHQVVVHGQTFAKHRR